MKHLKQTDPCIFYARPSHRESYHTDMSRGLPYHYVARMRRGTGHIVLLSGEELHLAAGDVFYFPMGMRYHSYWYGDGEGENCCVEWDTVGFTFLPDFSGRHFAPQILKPDKDGMALLEHLFVSPFDTVSGSGYLYLFLGQMLPGMAELKPDAKQQQLARVRYYISRDPGCSVAELAKLCGMSQSSLYALFRSVGDMSISELKNQIRVEQAIELLVTTDLSVEEISRRLEFCSAAYFRAVFRRVTGKAPTSVRREESGSRML